MPRVYSLPDNDAVARGVAKHVAACSAAAIAEGGRFVVALSGGSLPKVLATHLTGDPTVDWSKWFVFFADERVVPLDHPDSNHLACAQELFTKVPIPSAQVFPIAPQLAPAAAAEEYAARLRTVVGEGSAWPWFDLVLLGMGPDGHTCSLFPRHPLLEERSAWVAAILDSPKPPPERITLTYPVLEAAKEVVFVSTGGAKAGVMRQVLEDDIDWHEVPAKHVTCAGQVVWFVDDAAAAQLQQTELLKTR